MTHLEPQQLVPSAVGPRGESDAWLIRQADITQELATYLQMYPDEATPLSEPMRLLARGGCTSRHDFPMHVTVGALLVRAGTEILLVQHRAYGILLQPGGHLELSDATSRDAALRDLAEETGVDPQQVVPASRAPVYIEYGQVPARPAKGEPEHHHLNFGYAFTTRNANADVGRIQESEVTGAGWYPLSEAARRVGHRIQRAAAIPGPAVGGEAR